MKTKREFVNSYFSSFIVLRSNRKYKSYKRWAKGCVCQDKINTMGHFDCEENACDDCALEFVYESFVSDWDVTIPEPEEEDEEALYPFSYYDKYKMVDPTSGEIKDQHVYKTDFLPFDQFMGKYLSNHFF